MNDLLRFFFPPDDTPLRILLPSYGASGLVHALAALAAVTWSGSITPRLFPPPQGFNSVHLTASSMIVLEHVTDIAQRTTEWTVELSDPTNNPEGGQPLRKPEPTRQVVEPVSMPPTVVVPSDVAALLETTATRRQESTPPDSVPELRPLERTRMSDSTPPPPTPSAPASPASQQSSGQLDDIPKTQYSPQPEYPAAALQRRIEGRVVLRVQVALEGHVASAVVMRSSGHAILDEAARRCVLEWRFEPMKQSRRAVATEIAIPISFEIRDE